MIKLETVFAAADALTPEFAAKLADHASCFQSSILLGCADKMLSLDSLICILALELYRGVSVSVVADGSDEQAAAAEIVKVLKGEI